jgi:uncharacterized protein YuzE
MSKIEDIVRFTYDAEVDAAYISLTAKNQEGSVSNTVGLDDDENVTNADINLDFDKSGKLLGIEVLNASQVFREDIFEILKK